MGSKIKIEDIKENLEEQGWKLLSKEYKNLKENLEIECPEGHLNYVPYSKLRNGNYKCPICKQNNYYNVDNVSIKKKGYRVLALDQATITSGWSIFDGEQLVKYGYHTSEGKNSVDKIAATK